MKISFVRHGESEANILKLLSSKKSDTYKLTQNGINQIINAAQGFADNIGVVYASPFLRTLQSANIIIDNISGAPRLVVDDRIGEINYGKYNGRKNDEALDLIRKKQIAGDYEIRFGDYGENKREIMMRICSFLIDVIDNQKSSDHIIAVSHSVVISLAERLISQINDLKHEHVHTSNASVKTFALSKNNRNSIQQIIVELNKRKEEEKKRRVELVKNKFKHISGIRKDTKTRVLDSFIRIASEGLDNAELNNYALDQLTDGLCESRMELTQQEIDMTDLGDDDVVIICAFRNAENLISLFINHHREIGIKNFVFIDNNSNDGSVDIIKKYHKAITTDIWFTDDRFDSFKSCGWRQRMMLYYGVNRWYLDLDVDELFVYSGIENGGIRKIIDYARKNGIQTIGSIMLDTYSDMPVFSIKEINPRDIQKTYRYIDFDTYIKQNNDNFKFRVFGGPRYRKFHISPFLQKFPLIFIKDDTVNINPHFWYPFSINHNSRLVSALLHYKFLPGDFEKYKDFVNTGIHWDNSREYKAYVDGLQDDLGFTFFDNKHSIEYKNSKSLEEIQIIDNI